jgi:DUF4097 and DUF4098 domain-containing protein YvlB
MAKRGDAYSVDGGTLRLNSDCGWKCRADIVVTVPRGTRVTGENGTGDLSLTGVSGVDARSRSGDVRLRDVSGDVKLDLTSGDVRSTRWLARSTSVAPAGSYQIHTDTSSGDVKTGLNNDPNGNHKIDARTSSGDIELAAGS